MPLIGRSNHVSGGSDASVLGRCRSRTDRDRRRCARSPFALTILFGLWTDHTIFPLAWVYAAWRA